MKATVILVLESDQSDTFKTTCNKVPGEKKCGVANYQYGILRMVIYHYVIFSDIKSIDLW